jgi:pimeloyl-ACP methyl ester carboxylesterase
MSSRRHVLLGGAVAAASPHIVQAQAPAAPGAGPRAHAIRTPDGQTLRAYEQGNPQGRPILFIHGYLQAALSWERQMTDPALQREFRLVALDLRGHGMSDKPVGDSFYKPAQPWADDIAATIAALGLQRPVLAGWSYGGRVIGDYLTVHGHAALGGINFVDATTSSADAARFGRGGRFNALAGSEDPLTAIRGTASFLRECFETQPTTAEFETMLAFNMMVPRHVRLALLGRPAAYEAQLRALDIPVLVTQGLRDKLIDPAMSRFTAATVPNARLSEYEHVGHSPFWEDTERFNRELAALAQG